MAFSQVSGQPYYYDPSTGQYGVPQVSWQSQPGSTLDAFGLPQPSGPTVNNTANFGIPDASRGYGYGLNTASGWGTLGAVPQGFDTSSVLSGYKNQPGANVSGFYTGNTAPQVIGAGAGPTPDGAFGFGGMPGLAILGAFGAAGGLGALGAGAAGGGSSATDAMAGLGGWAGATPITTGMGATGGSMAFDLMDPSTWGLPSDVPTLPGTASNIPDSAAMGGGGPTSDWWSQYGLSSDPTALSGAGTTGGSSILKTIGNALGSSGVTGNSLASILGKLGAAGLGAYGANQQAGSLNNLAQQYLGFGAPSRARYEASMTPGFDPTSIPGYSGALDTASKSILAKLSASGGNPYGNPGGLIDANKQIVSGTALPAVQEYQRMNANTGFGSSMNAAVPLQTQAIGAQGNVLNSLGYGLNAVTNPQPSLSDILRSFSLPGVA